MHFEVAIDQVRYVAAHSSAMTKGLQCVHSCRSKQEKAILSLIAVPVIQHEFILHLGFE